MRAGPAADNETGGTNGCKSTPIINPHSRQLLNYYEDSPAHMIKKIAHIFAHFYYC